MKEDRNGEKRLRFGDNRCSFQHVLKADEHKIR